METTRTLTDKILLIIKGLAMGAANKVPGVSGGIVAFVAGFYEEFIYSLQKINGKAFKLLFNGRFKSFLRYTNFRFLGLLILGMVISYFSVSRLLDYFMKHWELYVWATFFGMIIGSIYYISKDFSNWNRKTVIAMIIGAVVGVSISFLSPAKENGNLIFVFFCGIISISGMTLPGLSGSFILILLGNYVLLLVDSVNALAYTIGELFSGDTSFINNPERIRLLKILTVFTFGSLFGLITLSHLLSYILKHYKDITTATIIGFITGSLGVVWPWKETIYTTDSLGNVLTDSAGNQIVANYSRFLPDISHNSTWIALIYVIFGILIVLGLEWYGKKRQEKLIRSDR
ncbi:DUF368 domain-containing protein [Capnocytophaga canimorsus]|uniref:DUF368 domain-containing protein n=1 Tax=Capnocytophaga canimorsus TaxID=28188 RepID=UPI0037D0CB8C